jgi:hypothetical protein
MVPHVIRLHSAWRLAAHDARAADRAAPTYVRSFGRPTGLTAADRIWLVCDAALVEAALMFNGTSLRALGAAALPLEFDVTESLAARNELRLQDRRFPGRPGGSRNVSLPEGLIGLEIRHGGWIRDLGLGVERVGAGLPQATLVGAIAGPDGAGGRTEISVAAAGSELHYAEGLHGEFEFRFPGPGIPDWNVGAANSLGELEVRLLADGRTCWQTRLSVAARQPLQVTEGRCIALGDRELGWPASWSDVPAATESWSSAVRGLASQTPLAALSQIMPAAFYDACDAHGLGVLQQVPPAASPAIIRNLSRHPSILICRQTPIFPSGSDGNRPVPIGLR